MGTNRKKVDTWWFSIDDVMEKQIQLRKEVLRSDLDDPLEDDGEDAPPKTETVNRMEERKIAVELFMEKVTDEGRTPPHPLERVKAMSGTVIRQIEDSKPVV